MLSRLAEVDDFAAVHPSFESVPCSSGAVLAFSRESDWLLNQYSIAIHASGWMMDRGGKTLAGDGIRSQITVRSQASGGDEIQCRVQSRPDR